MFISEGMYTHTEVRQVRLVAFVIGLFIGTLLGGIFLAPYRVNAQTSIITPSGVYLCLPGSMATICGSTSPSDNLTILPLGNQTYAVTPMAPTMPVYPSLDEPKQPRESSTPFLLMPSEAKPEGRFDTERPKVPCYSLYRDC